MAQFTLVSGTVATGNVVTWASENSVKDGGLFSLVVTAAGGPITAPPSIGAIYIDTMADTVYIATGASSVSDWLAMASL